MRPAKRLYFVISWWSSFIILQIPKPKWNKEKGCKIGDGNKTS